MEGFAMAYDFTTIIDRTGWDAMAMEGIGTFPGFAPEMPADKNVDVIPMWVADMNFATVPTVQKAITDRVAHPVFGYFLHRQEYYDAIIRWQKEHNGAEMTAECIGYENGVLGGLVSALNVLCSRGDKVLLHSPTYVGFTNTLGSNGYQIVHSPLIRDEAGVWRMDFADMEKKIVEHKIHAAVFCSPHNPCGRVWEKWEIEQAMEIYRRHDVLVVSDEIWSDLILSGYRHIPTQSVSEDAKQRTVALYAPSKTFNLAGLIGSYHVIYNQRLRDRVRKESSLGHYNEMNLLSMYALMGAYTPEGEQWLRELLEVLTGNVDFACRYMEEHFAGVTAFKPQGTYMLFADCTDWCEAYGKTIDDVLRACWNAGVMVQDGRAFHGPCHLRINLALPRSRVEEAFRRMDRLVFNA